MGRCSMKLQVFGGFIVGIVVIVKKNVFIFLQSKTAVNKQRGVTLTTYLAMDISAKKFSFAPYVW